MSEVTARCRIWAVDREAGEPPFRTPAGHHHQVAWLGVPASLRYPQSAAQLEAGTGGAAQEPPGRSTGTLALALVDLSRMGLKAREVRDGKRPRFRVQRLNADEKAFLHANATYEGSPDHKRNPGDFGLTPPANPRKDKTLCDEAAVLLRGDASALFARAIEGGLVSEGTVPGEFPRRIWLVHESRVFELKLGGSVAGSYHGYPVRRSNPYFGEIVDAWNGA